MSASVPIPERDGLTSALETELARDPSLATIVVLATELLDDEHLRTLVADRLAEEARAVEPMLAELRGAVAYGGFEVREPFDEARHLNFGIRFAEGEEMSVAVLVDHLAGMQLTDGLVLGQSIDEVRRLMAIDEDVTIADIEPSELRGRLDDVIWSAHHTLPPPVTETWPDNAILIEWAVRKLPEPSARPEWEPMSDEAEARFIESFLASDERRSLGAGDQEVGEAVAMMLWFKDGYTNGDPHRWGPGQTEYFLTDWALRKVIGDDSALRRYPEILRALIPWCHRQIGLAPRHTANTLEALDHFEPDFLEGLKPGRPTGIDALIQATQPFLLGSDPTDEADEADLDEWWANHQAKRRVDAVGGLDRLRALDVDPLPAGEAPNVDHLDDAVRSTVTRVATDASRVAAELYGSEYGTAAGRLAVRVAEADPKAFERGRPESAIAGLVWMVASANGRRYSTNLADIQRAAGTAANPKDRARTFAKALGAEPGDVDDLLLGSPDLLVSTRRQQLIDEEAATPHRGG